MATTKNSNLFYQLYSKSNDVTSSGYVCSSAVDEADTSFDINGDAGVITDSNGDELCSIDLSDIHIDGLTQYNTETRILLPHSAYLLLGNEYGETYKQQWFEVCELLSKHLYYEEYCNISFDILYKQKNKRHNVNINTSKVRKMYGSFIDYVQTMLNKLKIPVSISIHTLEDENSSERVIDYIKFESTEEQYDFIIRNVTLYPILSSDNNIDGSDGDYFNSPFTEPNIDMDFLTSLFEKFLPRIVGDTSKRDTSKPNHKYQIDCGAYKDMIDISQIIMDDFNTFCYELDILKNKFLPLFSDSGKCVIPIQFNELKEKYPEIYYKYFSEDSTLSEYNINDIVEMLEYCMQYKFDNMVKGPHKLLEDINKRIDACKYPNGSMRGIVIVPSWPVNEESDDKVLLVNHVADKVEIAVPIQVESLRKYFGEDIKTRYKARLFEKAIASVKINALISEEQMEYIEDIDSLPLNDITSNDGFTNSFDYLDEAGYDTNDFVNNQFHRKGAAIVSEGMWEDNHIDYYEPNMYLNENTDDVNVWENNPNASNCNYVDTHENLVPKVIGLYKYMLYLTNNDLWLRVGDIYMISGKKDNKLSKTKNLLLSVLIYNPNDIPIRVKYMIFS